MNIKIDLTKEEWEYASFAIIAYALNNLGRNGDLFEDLQVKFCDAYDRAVAYEG